MRFTLLLCLFILIVGCQEKKNNEPPKPLGDINLVILSSDKKIDSVAISSINSKNVTVQSFNEDTIRFNIEKPLNDLYKVTYYSKEHISPNQLWLDGEKVVVTMEVNKQTRIKNVINSPLYTTAKEYSSSMEKLYENPEENKEEIDAFLLKATGENINSSFAFAPAEIYLYRNERNPENLKKLDSVLKKMPYPLKKHKLSMTNRLQNIRNSLKP